MAEENLPPQNRQLAYAAAGGGFGGALLAIIVAKLLAGPCCCLAPVTELRQPAKAVSVVTAELPPVATERAGAS